MLSMRRVCDRLTGNTHACTIHESMELAKRRTDGGGNAIIKMHKHKARARCGGHSRSQECVCARTRKNGVSEKSSRWENWLQALAVFLLHSILGFGQANAVAASYRLNCWIPNLVPVHSTRCYTISLVGLTRLYFISCDDDDAILQTLECIRFRLFVWLAARMPIVCVNLWYGNSLGH